MKDVHDSIAGCIGATPAVRLGSIASELPVSVFGKLEYMNPGCALKDRTAAAILDDAEERGLLRPGATIIEADAANLGVGLAMLAAARGYRSIFVLPDTHTEEKRATMRALGARVQVVPGSVHPDDPRSARSVAQRLRAETPDAFLVEPCHSPVNPRTHYEHTGPEVWEQFDGELDVLVGGLGTGGTLTGVGRYLKERSPAIKVVGIDVVGSVYYDYFHTGQLTQGHESRIEGLGHRFVPESIDFQYLDDVFRVSDKDAFQMARRLAREEGLLVGGGSGAVVAGTLRYLALHGEGVRRAVAILPDSGHRYLSSIYDDTWMRENGFLEPDSGLGSVRDLLRDMGQQELVTVEADARATEVIGVLKLHGISQVPVLRDGKLLGVLSENRLLERALRGGPREAAASDLVESDYCTVDEDTELVLVLDLFRRARVAVVLQDGLPTHIITRIDIIDYLSRTASSRDTRSH